MRSHTAVALLAAGLAAFAAFVMAQSVRRLDVPPSADPTWAAQLLGSVLRTEAATVEPGVGAVRRALEPGESALGNLQRWVGSSDARREAAALEDAYRRWRVALERGLELRERPEAEVQVREERLAARERLLEQVQRVTELQHRETVDGQEATLAAARHLRLGAALAVLATLAALLAAFLGARTRAERPAVDARPLGALTVEQTTLTVPLNAEQEVAVRLEVRSRR